MNSTDDAPKIGNSDGDLGAQPVQEKKVRRKFPGEILRSTPHRGRGMEDEVVGLLGVRAKGCKRMYIKGMVYMKYISLGAVFILAVVRLGAFGTTESSMEVADS